ncbi:lysophospholipid acyltransferase family protein [bacterium]|nr:lysophospholipid acyltransferase family protein [bacterium]
MDFKVDFLSFLVKAFFKIEEQFAWFKNINYPSQKQVIFALWHAHQCALYCCEDKDKLNVLISKSRDGEIITRATKFMGINVVRGSQNRGGARASIELIQKLEQGENIAITIDGPKGPRRKVKEGIIVIAKQTQVPIVPLVWYSPEKNFLNIKSSWDGLRVPIGFIKILVSFGEPMYVPSDATKEQIEEYRLKLEEDMQKLYDDLKQNFDEYLKK